MKILVLSDDFPPQSFGGAGIVAFTLAKEMQQRGHEILIVTTVRDKKDEGRIEHEGLHIERIASSYNPLFQAYISLWNPQPVRRVRKILAEFKPEVVHAHNIHAHLSYRALVEAKHSGARVILTCHDVMSFHFGKFTEFIDNRSLDVPDSFRYKISPWRQARAYRLRYNPFRNIYIRHVLRRYVDHVVAVSHSLQAAMTANGIGRVEMIHNGIDTANWQIAPWQTEAVKAELGLAGQKVALFSGRLEGAKGGWNIIRAFEIMAREMPEARLLVLAQIASAKEKMAYAEKNGFGGQIVFAGWRTGAALREAYSAADVVVNPSICLDTFGLVNIEAMALKKPVVATCFGGSPEIVLDGQTGYIVNPHDVATMVRKISELLANNEKANRFGQAGYERAVKEFSIKKQADAYEAVYRQ
jgi:glycosyltransferase involved in cell wall biosynthesis